MTDDTAEQRVNINPGRFLRTQRKKATRFAGAQVENAYKSIETKRKRAQLERDRKADTPALVFFLSSMMRTIAFLFSVSTIVLLSFWFADLEVVLTEFIRRGGR